MIYLVWTFPALAVIAALASGRVGTLAASTIGLGCALLVALLAAPQPFLPVEAGLALLRGGWIGWIITPYILGGLLFWQIATRSQDGHLVSALPAETTPDHQRSKRRLLFTACFLVGPFAESATGFGVGIIGTMMLVRRLDVPPLSLIAFSLLSQTMILWGGMGSGAIVAAAFARTDPTTLVLHASSFLVVVHVIWLPLYWRMAKRAGLKATRQEHAIEALWLVLSLTLVIAATWLLGPEVAMLAAYGPVIVLRFLSDNHHNATTCKTALVRILPFIALIGWLVLTRLVPALKDRLEPFASIAPFDGAPAWAPFFHAGTWLVIAALVTGIMRGHTAAFPTEIKTAWKTGRLAVLTIITFSMMAELLSGSGIANGLANGLFVTLGGGSILLTPLISAVFGALANSGNAANGLFMASHVSLAAQAGLNGAAVVALQHMAALSLNMISPVRMSIVCTLAGTRGSERAAYRMMAPFALAILAVLLSSAMLIAVKAL